MNLGKNASVAELVDALDSKSSSFGVGVRFPPGVLKKSKMTFVMLLFFRLPKGESNARLICSRGLAVRARAR